MHVIRRFRAFLARTCVAAVLLDFRAGIRAAALVEFDFTRPETAREWSQPHEIAALRPAAEGLEIAISGADPYFHGPPRDYPPDTPLWMIIRMKSDHGGMAEVFYFRERAEAGRSVQFSVPPGKWIEARVPMPALGPGYRLRIDPPGAGGTAWLSRIMFEKRVQLAASWPAWTAPGPAPDRALAAGGLELFFGSETPLAFELKVNGESMAFAHPRPRAGYLDGEQPRWVDFSGGGVQRRRLADGGWALTARSRDPGGAEWLYEQRIRAGESSNTLAIETSVTVSEDRDVFYLPMQLLIAGEKSFGRRKSQGLFAGLEYLEDEPSSSEADIIGPESNRRVPAPHKITFPLMAIQARDRYIGLIWEEPRSFSALFDSPDRVFGGGGHVLGVLFPGFDGAAREEGNVLPQAGQRLKGGRPLVSRAWMIGGMGRNITPAVEHYVRLRGMPGPPDTGLTFPDYVSLATQGWLVSKCRETNLYRHAVWPGFNPQPAADAALFEMWLAGHTPDPAGANALRSAALGALSMVNPRDYYHSAISHVRGPAAPLLFGSVPEAVEAARATARAQLGRFSADGTIPYRASGKGPDYGKTHFAPDANGLTARVVLTLLESAAFCGDAGLIREAVSRLRGLDKFRGTVPRGAQTWEVPLHTPDILASAHLVRAYTMGYELTGENDFLEQARYWAWTGVPFVYLVNPTEKPIGPYSTIAVFGATNWKAPVWFGRPVQWCGMVYADSLYRFARHDPAGPWRKLADGITRAGLQHTWPASDRQRVGLLPDFFDLRSQTRDGPAINPGTVGACAIRLYGQTPLDDFRAFRDAGLLVHAPGEIEWESESAGRVEFRVRGWSQEPYFVLVTGLAKPAAARVNGVAPEFVPERIENGLILKIRGDSRVRLEW